jgi:thiol-disulfide isomerase/thioredoxin/DNA-binding beta-propeller fold protein YncE
MNIAPQWLNWRSLGLASIVGLILMLVAWLPNGATPTSSSAQAQDKTSPKAAGNGEPAAEDKAKPGTPPARAAKVAAANPFPRRLKVPEFPKDREWINSGPLSIKELKGKFVLLDFWTYCCINCMHILPELKKLERQYPNELVVIGVHSAKFETEKDTKSIREAVLRYEIEHPVVNDAEHEIWDTYGVNSWPTAILIDPEGNAVWGHSGEFKAEQVDQILKAAIPYYRENKLLNETPIKFALERENEEATPLRFPGKILADEAGGRLFITDSNHNRIVIASLDGKLIDVIGNGQMGRTDGSFEQATFDHPQGCALRGDTLYVADTENHLLRKVDLNRKTVTTIAGTGEQGRHPWPGLDSVELGADLPKRWVGAPLTTALNSPWALWIHDNDLYIAMAGPHQIWKMPLDEKEIGPYAGNGREDIVDGPLLPRQPYGRGFASFAQPSGLSSDGTWLYVADSEGSSIRAVPFNPQKEVRTVVGSAHLPTGRLFAFGDEDGPRLKAKLQHCLEVAYHDGQLYVADTYNNKIKVVDAKTGVTNTLAGTGEPGHSDMEPTFDEPAGLSVAAGKLYIADTNNHLIRTLDLESGEVKTLPIQGLTPPKKPEAATVARPARGEHTEQLPLTEVKATDGAVQLEVALTLPRGWKLNPLAPMGYQLDATGELGPIDRAALGKKKLNKPQAEFTVPLTVKSDGQDEINVTVNYYYCQEKDEGVCKISSVTFVVPLKITPEAKTDRVVLRHTITE